MAHHQIKVAKLGITVEAVMEGNLKLETSEGKIITVNNVLVCDSLSHNLLSVKKIVQNGCTVTFKDGTVHIKRSGKQDTIIEGSLQGNLYIVELSVLCSPMVNISSSHVVSDANLWHRRMGHSSKFPSFGLCKVCLEGKQTQKPYVPVPEERKARQPMDIVSTDVCGPLNPASHNGKKYFLTFIDHYTHFTMCYFLETKNEVFVHFKNCISMVENQFNRRPVHLMCDNGGEYVSHDFKNFCLEKGIP